MPVACVALSYSHLPEHSHFVDVAVGETHCAAVTLAGTLFTWGSGPSGQLGQGDFREADAPEVVQDLIDSHVVVTSVACGAHHTLAGARMCPAAVLSPPVGALDAVAYVDTAMHEHPS